MACRQVDFKDSLVRLVTRPEGIVMVDSSGLVCGRGGYLHLRRKCLEDFARPRAKRLNSLRVSLDFPKRLKLVELLMEQLAQKTGLE